MVISGGGFGRGGGADEGYLVPSGRHRVEQVVRGSRFITTLDRAGDPEAARRLLAGVEAEFPDATHHCWAYVAGPAADTASVGMSDAGEPHGTAGRPMLDVLLHSGVGEVAAVVTRYYGGTKLGRGGLARAYAGGVKEALASATTERRVHREPVQIDVSYPALDPLLRYLEEIGAQRASEDYGAAVRLRVQVPSGALDALRRKVADLTGGEGTVEPEEPTGAG